MEGGHRWRSGVEGGSTPVDFGIGGRRMRTCPYERGEETAATLDGGRGVGSTGIGSERIWVGSVVGALLE